MAFDIKSLCVDWANACRRNDGFQYSASNRPEANIVIFGRSDPSGQVIYMWQPYAVLRSLSGVHSLVMLTESVFNSPRSNARWILERDHDGGPSIPSPSVLMDALPRIENRKARHRPAGNAVTDISSQSNPGKKRRSLG